MTDTHNKLTAEYSDMTQLWLVERSYDDRNLISFVYATVDGQYQLRKELSMTLLQQRGPQTAAIEVDESELSTVDESDRERYATEAKKMAADHEPDDEI